VVRLDDYKPGSAQSTWQKYRHVRKVLRVYHWEITYQQCYVFSWPGVHTHLTPATL